MCIHELMERMSYREFKVRLALLNRPSMLEHYLMRITQALTHTTGDYMKWLIPWGNVKRKSSQQEISGYQRARQTRTSFAMAFGKGKKPTPPKVPLKQ